MIFYRYTNNSYWTESGLHVLICLKEYELARETPKGYWIAPRGYARYDWQPKRWVSKTSRRRFAYPDKDLAWGSFMARASGRVGHLKRQLEAAEKGFALAKDKGMDAVAITYTANKMVSFGAR